MRSVVAAAIRVSRCVVRTTAAPRARCSAIKFCTHSTAAASSAANGSSRIHSGIASLKDFVDRARANPGKIKNGNDQPGGSSYIGAALYEKLLNVKLTKVSYAGFGPTVIGLMGGEVDSATVPVPDTIR